MKRAEFEVLVVPSESDADTSRTAVKTYVPSYQKETWKEHADRLDMSLSEFIRTMVQAGRRDFSFDDDLDARTNRSDDTAADLSETIVGLLEEEEFLSWNELLERTTDDIESRLEDAVEELQERNRIRYSGKNNGYEIVER